MLTFRRDSDARMVIRDSDKGLDILIIQLRRNPTQDIVVKSVETQLRIAPESPFVARMEV